MTNPVTPATDAEVYLTRKFGLDGELRLVARIDAERTARERAEATLAENTQPPLASNLGGYHAVRDAIADAVGHEHTWGWPLVVAVRGLAVRAERAVSLLVSERAEARARAIRAVVAAQWGVACVLYQTDARCDADAVCWMLADLPTAEQIVDGAA